MKFHNLEIIILYANVHCIKVTSVHSWVVISLQPSQVQRCVEISKENLCRYSDVKDRASTTEVTEILPSCSAKLHKEVPFQVQNETKGTTEAEIEDSLEETSQDLVKNSRQADLKKPQISDIGSIPKQDASSLLETKLPNTLLKDLTESEQSQNVSNGEDDKTPRKQHLIETLDAVESTGFSKDALETKAKADNTKNKQTLKELENELDLLLAL